MKYSTSVLILNLLSVATAQQGFYNLGQPYYPGLAYPQNYAGLAQQTQQPQYVSSSQQQHLVNLAQQQQKLLAMSQQFNKPPQMMYTQIAGLNALRPKLPVYKPQYAYTKVIQPFVRPQKPVAKLPSVYPAFVKMPTSYTYPTMQLKNITKPQAISTYNHMVKPNPVYMPSTQNLISGQSPSHKYLTQAQPLKYTQLFNSFPNPSLVKPASVPPKNYLSLQSPKNTLNFQTPKNYFNYQFPKNTLSFQTSANSLALQSPQTVINYQPPKTKNVLTLQTPSNLGLSMANLHKNTVNTQSYVPSSNTNTNYYTSANTVQHVQKPQTFSTFLGQTLVKNEPSESFHSSGPGISYSNQVLKSTGAKTILMPVKSEGERGPIHTIPAPNLSLGDKSQTQSSYKPEVQHSPIYTYQVPKLQPSYEVTEPSTEKNYQEQGSSQHAVQYTPQSRPSVKNTYTSSSSSQFSPMVSNTQSYQSVQPSQQALSTQEFYDLLNGVTPQQQLPDTYTMPLLQQPQLQQHFMQQTIGVAPLRPFNAIIQPIYNSKDTESILFKPDPNYVHKIQDQYLNQGSSHQPSYHVVSESNSADALKAEIEALVQQHDSSNVHYNIVRNAQEGTHSANTDERSAENTKTINHIKNEDKINDVFAPTAIPEANNELTVSKPVVASYYTQVSGPDNSVSNYFSPLTNKEVEETLATIQAASNLMKAAHNHNVSDSSYASTGFQPYFTHNSPSNDVQYKFVSQANNVFTPIKGSSMTVSSDNGNAPIRIYVPDQYDDIETQSSQDIRMSASMNTQDNTNEQNIIGSYDTVDTEQNVNNQQEYVDYQQVPENQENNTNDARTGNLEYTTVHSDILSHPEDVIVLLQRNHTDPSLDILTKDWKTSIVIKSKDKETTSASDPNQLDNDFGNRLRPKRNQEVV